MALKQATATTNTGILHFVQDDGVKHASAVQRQRNANATATATATATAAAAAAATTNTGVLHFVQDDGVEHASAGWSWNLQGRVGSGNLNR